jgi:hypothetical protein
MTSMSHPVLGSNRNRFAAALATALLALALFAGPSKACSYSGAEKVFSPWGDQHDYVLAPDGGLEAAGSGWQLNHGAAVVEGNESYYLNGAGDSKSLSLPPGSSAVSPPVCMAIDTPIFRMVARNTGNQSSKLQVTASYRLLGLLRTQTVGTVTGNSSWEPTNPQSTVLTLSTVIGTLIPSAIEIRFTPLGSGGQWQVDDVYVDPFRR